MSRAALQDCYVDTTAAPQSRRPLGTLAPVVADGGGGNLVYLAQVGPRVSVQVVIETPRRVYRLRGTFAIRLSYPEDGLVVAEHSSLPVSGHGATPREALEELDAMFDEQYRTLVDVAESCLTNYAKKVRARFQAVVEGVEDR